MRIEAATRLLASEEVSFEEVKRKLEQGIKAHFPKSHLVIAIKQSVGSPYLAIHFALGSGKQDFPGGYFENDPVALKAIVFKVVAGEGMLKKNVPYKFEDGLGYYTTSGYRKVTRAFTAKTVDAFVKKLIENFAKLAQDMKQHIDMLDTKTVDYSSYIK